MVQYKMGKSITKLPDYAVANNQVGTLTQVSGNTFEGTVAGISQIISAIGASIANLYGLVASSLVNKWAAYKPGYISASGSPYDTYTYVRPSSGLKIGDWIGYNHNAKPPVHYANSIPSTYEVEQGEWGQIDIQLARGEMNPCGGSSDKNYVDVQLQYNGGIVQHNRISIPAVGSLITTSFYQQIIAAGTLSIKPVYYFDNYGSYTDLAIIEDGVKNVSISVTSSPLNFSGDVSHILPYPINPMSVRFDWSLTNNMSINKNINARIKIYGDYVAPIYASLSLSEFSPSETQSGTINISVLSTGNGVYQGVLYELQIAKNIDPTFGFSYLIDNDYFMWTPEE